jgi:hypothetical protein
MSNRVIVLENYLIENNILEKDDLYSNELIIYFRKIIEESDYKQFLVNCFNEYKALLNNKIIEHIEDGEDKEDVSVDYLNKLIAKYLKMKFATVDDLIENVEVLDEELQTIVHQYSDLKLPLSNYIDVIENLLKEKNLVKLLSNLIESNNYSIQEKRIIFLFLEIIKVCGIPYTDEYLMFLKSIFIRLGKENIYDRLMDTFDLLQEEVSVYDIELENLIKQVNTQSRSVLMESTFKSKFSGLLTSMQVETLQNDLNFIYKIKDLRDETIIEEILNEKIYVELGPLLSTLTKLDVILSQNENINDLKKRLKYFDYDDEFITNALKLYEIKVEKTNHIILNAQDPLVDDIWLSIFNEYKYSLNLSKMLNKHLKINIEKLVNNIFMDMIFQANKHMIKSYDFLLENVQSVEANFFNSMYYNYNDDKQIRVLTKNMFDEYFLYIREQLRMLKKEKDIKDNKYVELFLFIVDKMLTYIIEYEVSYMGDNIKYIDFILNENLQIIINENTKVHPNSIPIVYSRVILEILELASPESNSESYKSIQKNVNELNKKINIYNKEYVEKEKIPAYISKIIKNNPDLTKESIHFLMTSYRSNLLSGLSSEDSDDKRLGQFLNMYISSINSYVSAKKEIGTSKTILLNKYDLDKEVEKILKGEFQRYKKVDVYQPKKIIYTNEESKIYLDASNFYEENNLGFNDIDITRKYLSEKQTAEEVIKTLKDSAKFNYIRLMKYYFKRQVNQKEIDEILTFIESNFLKLNTIKKILLKFSNKIDYMKLNLTENSVFRQLVLMFVIIFIVDNYINASKDITKIDFSSIDMDEIKITNKDVIIKSSNKIGKVKTENKDNSINVLVDGEEIKISKDDIILMKDARDVTVKITTGIYKGKNGGLGIVRENKETEETLKIKNNHILYLEESLDSKIEYVSTLKVDKNTVYSKKEKDIIASVRNINKVKTTSQNKIQLSEFKHIESARAELIEAIQKEIIGIQTQLKLLKKQINETQYNIKIDIGTMNERTVRLNRNDFKIIQNKQEQAKIKKTPKGFDTIYSFIKYIFFSVNVIESHEIDLYQITFVQTLYKKILDLYNNSKMQNINKLVLIKKIDKKLRKFTLNYEKLNKKDVDAGKMKILKDTIKSLKIKKTSLERDIGKLSKYNIREINSTLEKFSKEYDLKKEDGVQYYVLKYNMSVLNQEKNILKKEESEKQEQYQKNLDKKSSQLIGNATRIVDKFYTEYQIDVLDNETLDLSLFLEI